MANKAYFINFFNWKKKFIKIKNFFLNFISINYFLIYLFTIFTSIFLDIFGISLFIPLLSLITGDNKIDVFNFPFLDFFFNSNYFSTIEIYCFLIFFVFFIRFLIGIFIIFIQSEINKDLKSKISIKLFNLFSQQNVLYFNKTTVSNLIRDLTHETKLCANTLLAILNIFADVMLVLGLIIFLFFFYPILTIVVSLIILSSTVIFYFFSKKILKKSSYIRQKVVSSVMANIRDLFYAFRELILNKGFSGLKNKFGFNFKKMERQTQIVFIIQNIPRYYLEFITICFVILLIFVQSNLDYSNQKIITTVGIFMAVALKMLPQVNRILSSYQIILYNKPAVDMLQNYFNTLNKKFKQNKKYYKSFKVNKIKLKDISFSYKNKQLFQNLSLILNKNHKVLIVGKSGVGKSTLLDIVAGLVTPSSGKITINNKNLIHILDSYRRKISYVSKNSYIFDTSFIENITFKNNITAKEKINLDKIFNICNLNEVINFLPRGENTLLSSDKVSLSSGQKQKLAIARALFKKPELVILDEATNSIDTETEKKIFQYLLKQRKMIFICVNHNSVNNNLFKTKLILKNKIISKKIS